MLTKLRLKNFKAWKDSGSIRLAPLTVLFGANSAGKTSIPQLLLLLKQTAEANDRKGALQFGDHRTLVDLGTYEDVAYNRDPRLPLEFELAWDLEQPLRITDPIHDQSFQGGEVNFQVSITADQHQQPTVQWMQYELRHDGSSVLNLRLERITETNSFKLTSTPYKLVRNQGRAWDLPEPFRFYEFPDEARAYYQNGTFSSDLVLELDRLLRGVFYLGPLREHPKRDYPWSGEVPVHVGKAGGQAIEAILAARDRTYNRRPRGKSLPLGKVVAERLRTMGLIHQFEIRPTGDRRKEYEVWVQTRAGLPQVKLTDVGFGISQILPVIVEAYYVPRRSIVILEQPEIHLHPRVQSELADLFVDAISARENGSPRNCQFIVESHSEHFLRRLQRRIAEGGLDPAKAALYFIRADGDSARLEPLQLDDYGNISNWPDGFFGDEMEDLVARSVAQATREAARRQR